MSWVAIVAGVSPETCAQTGQMTAMAAAMPIKIRFIPATQRLPATPRALVERQYQGVIQHRDRVHQLRGAVS